MGTKTTNHLPDRARRFALHLQVYFRQPHSTTWLEGKTENISYTGLLFRSTHPLEPETPLELKLQLAIGTKPNPAAEIRCKGAVVRVEHRNGTETPVALAVAITDYRIVRRAMLRGGPIGLPKHLGQTPKVGRRPH
jgi:hypothetical protein